MERFVLIILVVMLIAAVLTFALGKIAKRKRFLKYIPSILLLLSGIYNLYKTRSSNEGFEDLAYFLLALFLFAGFIGGILTAFFMDYVLPRINKKHRL